MEIWKTIKGFENYQASSFGRIKSLNYKRTGKERILKQHICATNYYVISICKDGKKKDFKIHQLIAMAFLNHTVCGMNLVVNHKDFNKLNNRVENLEIVTQRDNTSQKHLKSSSCFVGVCWHKSKSKWQSSITINGKTKYLGLFNSEIEAHNAYQNALTNLLT